MCYKKALLTTAAHSIIGSFLAILPDTQGGRANESAILLEGCRSRSAN